MLKRLRDAWKIAGMSNKVVLDGSRLMPEDIEALKGDDIVETELGDGKAEFFGEPTREDEIEHERAESGTKPWYDRLRSL